MKAGYRWTCLFCRKTKMSPDIYTLPEKWWMLALDWQSPNMNDSDGSALCEGCSIPLRRKMYGERSLLAKSGRDPLPLKKMFVIRTPRRTRVSR